MRRHGHPDTEMLNAPLLISLLVGVSNRQPNAFILGPSLTGRAGAETPFFSVRHSIQNGKKVSDSRTGPGGGLKRAFQWTILLTPEPVMLLEIHRVAFSTKMSSTENFLNPNIPTYSMRRSRRTKPTRPKSGLAFSERIHRWRGRRL